MWSRKQSRCSTFPRKRVWEDFGLSASFPWGKTLDLGIRDLLEPGIPIPAALSLGIGLLVAAEVAKGKLKIQGKAWRGMG